MSPTPARHALRRLTAASMALALIAGSVRSPALEGDQEEPLYLESDSAELDDAKSISIYTGNVFVKQGSMQITGNQVTVHHDQERKPKHIVSVGTPSTYRQEMGDDEQEVEAEALRMEYDADKDEITLIDKAVLFQGEDTFRSDRIVYDRANGLVKAGTSAQGKERVKITITPSKR